MMRHLTMELSTLAREFFIDYLLVRIHFIFVKIRWTGLAPWVFEFPFPGSFTSTFLGIDKAVRRLKVATHESILEAGPSLQQSGTK